MHVYSYCAVLCAVLAVMCICVTYKFLSLGLLSAARSGQAMIKIAKPAVGVGSSPNNSCHVGG